MEPKMPTPEDLAEENKEKQREEINSGDLEPADKFKQENKKENPISSLTGETLKEIRERIEKIEDIDEIKIEQGIREAVSAFNFAGLPTDQSCEGHIDIEDGALSSWIIVVAPNKPNEKCIKQNEVFEKVAGKYNISAEDVKKGIGENEEAYNEAWKLAERNGISPKWKEWNEENEKLIIKCQFLLDEFYKQKDIDKITQIKIKELEGGFRIYNGGTYEDVFWAETTPKDVDIKKRLTRCRKEFDDFADFLIKKYSR